MELGCYSEQKSGKEEHQNNSILITSEHGGLKENVDRLLLWGLKKHVSLYADDILLFIPDSLLTTENPWTCFRVQYWIHG